MGLDVREVHGPVGDHGVEPLHDHLLGDDREGLERCVLEAAVDLAVER